jgi:hypothetical protein
MKLEDIDQLDSKERHVLSASFYVNALDDRMSYVTADVALVIAVVVLLFVIDAPEWAFGLLLMSFVVIMAIEKASYLRSNGIHQSLIRKLVHRIEQVQGAPPTPPNAAQVEASASNAESAGL